MAQEPEYDLMSENEYDSADDPWFTRGFSQASDLESGDDSQSDQEKQEDRLIDIVLELEKQRDIKAREVERLRLEKREAEKRARNATRTAREVARKARVALQKTRESGYFSGEEEYKIESSDSEINNRSFTRRVRREGLSGDEASYGLDEQGTGDAVYRMAQHKLSKTNSGTRRSRHAWETLEERRKREEEQELKVRIKARPVPASTLVPRYERMREVAEARSLSRKMDRSDKLKESLAPFKGLELRAQKQAARRHEKERARKEEEENEKRSRREKSRRTSEKWRMAQSVQTLKEKQEEEERQRMERRDKRAQQLLRESRLPHRMALYNEEDGKTKKRSGYIDENCTFKPKVNTKVPDFEQSKQKWVDTLTRARRTFKPTEANVDDLSMFADSAKAREERNRKKIQAKLQAEENKRLEEKEKLAKLVQRIRKSAEKKKTVVNMTKSQELRLQLCAEAKDRQSKQELLEQANRKAKEDRLKERAKVIRKLVDESETKRKAQSGYLGLEEAELRAKERAKEDRKVWLARQKEMKEKMKNPRPECATLLERGAEKNRKNERRQNAMSIVAAALVKTNVADDKNLLDPEDLDLVQDKLVEDQLT
mmetsp:Transcript_55/g.96  ORF Transcript_55/g.96 Transcript_55/m.96 type:complete len:600 (+) Transcript_55:1089-2888(+)